MTDDASLEIKPDRIEFRIMGGNYLQKQTSKYILEM
jgi:hypothetical protein